MHESRYLKCGAADVSLSDSLAVELRTLEPPLFSLFEVTFFGQNAIKTKKVFFFFLFRLVFWKSCLVAVLAPDLKRLHFE